jgi:hypothetical protein
MTLVKMILAAWLPLAAVGLDNGVALTPPMGLNTWEAGITGEEQLLQVAQFFVDTGLRDAGYTFINSDAGWGAANRSADGKLQWSASYWKSPGGLPAFIDKLHKMVRQVRHPISLRLHSQFLTALNSYYSCTRQPGPEAVGRGPQGLQYGLYSAEGNVNCIGHPGNLYREDLDARTIADWGVDCACDAATSRFARWPARLALCSAGVHHRPRERVHQPVFRVSLTRNFDRPRADFKSDNCATYAMDPSVRFGAFRDALNRSFYDPTFSRTVWRLYGVAKGLVMWYYDFARCASAPSATRSTARGGRSSFRSSLSPPCRTRSRARWSRTSRGWPATPRRRRRSGSRARTLTTSGRRSRTQVAHRPLLPRPVLRPQG